MQSKVEEKTNNSKGFKNDLAKRLFEFSVQIIFQTRKLPKTPEYKVIVNQLIKAATSTGANYEEAQSPVSRADFSNKVGISLKEMRESNYWIRIILSITDETEAWKNLQSESRELMNILGKIYFKTSKKR